MGTAKLLGPWGYRRFLRTAERFIHLIPWLWILGCVGLPLAVVLRLGDRWLNLICALTFYPVLIGWLGFTGLGILWRRLLLQGRKGWGFSFSAVWVAFAIVCILSALMLLRGLLSGLGRV